MVGYLLRSEALYGTQRIFGTDWETLPALIDKETWDAIQVRRLERATEYYTDNAVTAEP